MLDDCDIQIVTAAITGAPCGGKTSLEAYVLEEALSQGVMVFRIPEMATLCFTRGVSPIAIMGDAKGREEVQRFIFRAYIEWENAMISIAKIQARLQGIKQVLILCDRTVLDAIAYMGKKAFWEMARKEGYSRQDIYKRYTLAICLATAANGAEEFYNLDNEARSESPEDARKLEGLILDAYQPLEHLVFISNLQEGKRISFEKKMLNAVHEIMNQFGIPMPLENEIAHLVLDRTFNEKKLRSAVQGSIVKQKITQCYLPSKNADTRIRIRKIQMLQPFVATYYVRTDKRRHDHVLSRLEKQMSIDAKLYDTLFKQRDTSLQVIEKMRYYFMYSQGPGEMFRGQLDRVLKPETSKKAFIYEHESVLGDLTKHRPPAFLGKTKVISGLAGNYEIAQGVNLFALE